MHVFERHNQPQSPNTLESSQTNYTRFPEQFGAVRTSFGSSNSKLSKPSFVSKMSEETKRMPQTTTKCEYNPY